MLSFIIVFAFVSSIYTLPLQSDISELSSLISSENCNFYSTLNTLFQCGTQSHLTQYSYKYCQRLVDTRNSFENTQYQDNVRQCLQQKLFAKIQQAAQGTITCDSFKQMDLDSHASCFAVSFKQLSANDVTKFIATFKDTTVNYAQLCKFANSLAGYWSQIVKGDLMQFVKKQLKEVFPKGDTSSCSIKPGDIIEEIIEIVEEVEKVIDQVKDIKNDIDLIIEKAKGIRDDFKTIQETIKGMQDGSISELDGLVIIIEETKSIAANSKTIIETIKNLGKKKANLIKAGEQEGNGTDISHIIEDVLKMIAEVETLKGEVYKIVDNVNSIKDIIDDIKDGKMNIIDGLVAIGGQLENGVDNIYSIIDTSYALKDTAVDLVETIIKDVEGAVGGIIDNGKETVDQAIGGATDAIGGAIDGIGGGLGGIGK